jgi:serine protease Do
VVNIKNPNYLEVSSANNYVISSEQYGKAILLTNDLEQTFLGSPLVNLAGEVIGVIKQVDDGLVTAVPIDQFRSIILDVLRSSIVKRPLLGVDYIDLASINGLSKDLTQGLNQGALIWKNPSRNTPAFAADLREDDIILNIDGQAVDSNSNLTQLIQQYQAGDQIDIEILRDGQTLSRTATLVIDLD